MPMRPPPVASERSITTACERERSDKPNRTEEWFRIRCDVVYSYDIGYTTSWRMHRTVRPGSIEECRKAFDDLEAMLTDAGLTGAEQDRLFTEEFPMLLHWKTAESMMVKR